MSEESEEKVGFFGQLKNQIITGAGAILATVGTIFIDEIKSIVGIEDETEQVQGAQQNNQQQQNVVINIPEQKAAETKNLFIQGRFKNGFRGQVRQVQVPRPHHPQGLVLARSFLLNQLERLREAAQDHAPGGQAALGPV